MSDCVHHVSSRSARLAPALCVVLASALGAGCKREGARSSAGTPSAQRAPAAQGRGGASFGVAGITDVAGLRFDASSQTFTWSPVAGAAQYSVMVAPVGVRGHRWTWVGAEPRVVYGDLAGPDDRLRAPAMFGDAGSLYALRAGQRYRWSVSAFNDRGALVALSAIEHFSR